MAKIKLQGYNNLTESLGFNIYNVCYAKSERERRRYAAQMDERYNSGVLTDILKKSVDKIGATILNISKQDYSPHGASANLLIAEDSFPPEELDISCNMGKLPGQTDISAHLDKSHMTVHTYPEWDTKKPIATYRVDIDLATCGNISPLSVLDFIIGSFDSDIIILDYKVRGFARARSGIKVFNERNISSLCHMMSEDIIKKYTAYDMNMPEANIYHTKMMIKEIDAESHIFGTDRLKDNKISKMRITEMLRHEMLEITSGKNLNSLK